MSSRERCAPDMRVPISALLCVHVPCRHYFTLTLTVRPSSSQMAFKYPNLGAVSASDAISFERQNDITFACNKVRVTSL